MFPFASRLRKVAIRLISIFVLSGAYGESEVLNLRLLALPLCQQLKRNHESHERLARMTVPVQFSKLLAARGSQEC